MEIKLKAGKKYSICSCGLSNILPYCDNTHREYNSKNGTEYKSVKIIPDKDTTIKVTSSRWMSNGEDE
jgi:CDGSH-type Zn-finger protein